MYAVVRKRINGNHSFAFWHESLDEARQEAMRLTAKEKDTFLVLSVIGSSHIKEQPVEYTDIKENEGISKAATAI